MHANEMTGMVLDIADEDSSTESTVSYRRGRVSRRAWPAQHFDQLSDELVGVRSRLTRYLGDLHGVNEKWGVSAYQTIQNLASIATYPTHPSTLCVFRSIRTPDWRSSRRMGGQAQTCR